MSVAPTLRAPLLLCGYSPARALPPFFVLLSVELRIKGEERCKGKKEKRPQKKAKKRKQKNKGEKERARAKREGRGRVEKREEERREGRK